ncbi:hypothetical protein Tco_0328454 [Tanacetum coccineum]
MNEDYYEQNSCYYPNSSGFDHPQPPQDSVDHQGILQILNELEEKFEEIIRDGRKKIEDMSEEIDEEYDRDCEIRIRKLKQDFNIWGSEVQKKEKAYEDEKYDAACRYMLSVTCDDEDDYIPLAITPDLPIEESENSLKMGDEHLDTIPATESDKVIKSSVENLVPIPSEFEDMSDDTSVVPNCDDNRVNVESELVESLINRDTSIDNSSKIDPIFEEFVGELAHIAPIPPEIVETDFDPNDDTSSDSFENIEYIDASLSFSVLGSLEEENKEQKEKEFDLEDILQIQDVILREKLLNVHRLISKIKSLKDNPTPDHVLESPYPFPIPIMDSDLSDTSLSHLDNSLPEFETFSDHTEETRSGSTTTHANYSLPENDSFLFEIEPDQGGITSVVISNNDLLLESPEFESFHFDIYDVPSFPRPPLEPPDVCLDMLYNDESFELSGDENIVVSNVEEDDSFTFTIRTFLPFLTYPEVSPLYCSTRSEDLIFDPGIVTFHKPVDSPNKFFEASRVRLIYPVLLELLILCVKLVWICQISQEISQKRTRERMSDQEAKELKAEARKIMPQPSTVNCS